jgi:SNF2 family DNA or RNA helicase
MYILHGTWIPEESDRFIQGGQFYLWVEIDQPAKPTKPTKGSAQANQATASHPMHLQGQELATFLTESLGIKPLPKPRQTSSSNNSLEAELVSRYFRLPTWDDLPLPSWEMAHYLELELPEPAQLKTWKIDCYPPLYATDRQGRVSNVIKLLHELYFLTQHRLIDVQMGMDLLFWHRYSQQLKQVILRDHYIPALKYRSVNASVKSSAKSSVKPSIKPAVSRSNAKAKSTSPDAFEIYSGWEIISADYDEVLQAASLEMPAVCCAGFALLPKQSGLYDAEFLLRHFSEVILTDILVNTPLTIAFEKTIHNTVLQDCLSKSDLESCWNDNIGLTYYQQWREWRDRINQSQSSGSFILAFHLHEPLRSEDPWRLAFQVALRSDPSQLLDLAAYWQTAPTQRRQFGFGDDIEQGLLLHLGYAARIYPLLWAGLETDQPSEVYLSLDQSFSFLQEAAWVLEDAGYRVIVPAWWTPKGRQRAKVKLRASSNTKKTAQAEASGYFSATSLASYDYEFAIGDESVSRKEWQQLVENKAPLVLFRGRWMALDRDKMKQMLEFWQKQQQNQPDLTLIELMKLSTTDEEEVELVVDHDQTLSDMMQRLRDKATLDEIPNPARFQGTLRPYQRRGVGWLVYLESLGLNGCLADDMGMGKSAQVIAHLVHERHSTIAEPPSTKPAPSTKTRSKKSAKLVVDELMDRAQSTMVQAVESTVESTVQSTVESPCEIVLPTLLIAPTSVVGNWGKELEKFAPHLRFVLHHGADRTRDPKAFSEMVKGCDVLITSYTLVRLDSALLSAQNWHRIVIDEAQNIKNPKAAQTKAILKLPANHRLALTGTPVENRLLDLWSIFNFLNPGYLGKESQFRTSFEIPIQRDGNPLRSATLKKLVEPFILRRVKTDPTIIQDLPDKVEQKCYCNLTREQAVLYELVVKEIGKEIETAEGIKRKAIMLATLMKLKQICNHPAQFLQDNSDFSADRSQKLERVLEMVDEIIDEGESLLLFTQFTEIGEALEKCFRQRRYNSYYLHGGTARPKREQMITEFQSPDTPPSIFVLSLKAGGVGITLTKANHVIHFDRWWNPAVENQATDRAFRIGQTKNVFVHKFITIGTLEEKIDQMIEDKNKLAGSIVGNDESWLSSLDNQSFKQLIALNRSAIVN